MTRKVILIVCASLVFTWVFIQFTPVSSLKNKVYDALFYFRGPVQDKGESVVIVAIDEASLEKIGNWPWSRSMLAWLIEKIKMGGPKVIGVDLLLDLPTRGKNAQIEDGKLAEVFKNPPACVLPVVVKEKRSGRFQETLFKPLDIFLTGRTVTGVVNVESDPADKITREFKAIYGDKFPSFPAALCIEYLGCSMKDLRIPMQNGRGLINYKCAKIDAFSASDVLEPFFNPVIFFKDKIVLIGRTDLASKDFVNTPVPSGKIFETQSMAGIELWKEIIDMILARNFLYGVQPLLAFLLAAFLSIVICRRTLRSNKIGAVWAVSCIAVCGLSFYFLFLAKNIVLPLLYLVAVCAVS